MIQLSGAGKRFGHKLLFENTDWLITPHDRVGLVGANGTGKSTLMKVLAGMDTLDYGSLTVAESTLPISGMASRLLRGQHPIWDEVESALAEWHDTEAALMMTSGYAANEGLLATVVEPGDWVATDELNHACIMEGLRVCRPRKFPFWANSPNTKP